MTVTLTYAPDAIDGPATRTGSVDLVHGDGGFDFTDHATGDSWSVTMGEMRSGIVTIA